MIRRLLLLGVAVLCAVLSLPPTSAIAQDRFVHTISSENKAAPYLGRDIWFCIPQNYQRSQQGAVYFFAIYISSPKNTTAHIQMGTNAPFTRQIAANQSTALLSPADVPTGMMLESSGVAEDKTVHIWSDDAVLSVYLLSRAPYTSDGMYCIPTIGWGTEYIVASYESFEISSAQADLPSEFAIVANQDNTIVQITPTADIRADQDPSTVLHPKGQSFTEILMKGQSFEYQTLGPEYVNAPDLTGTHITSNRPIGVIGASVCPDITSTDNSCDHVLDMLPPVRTWGKSYVTVSPLPGAGSIKTTYRTDGFLVVGTKAGQIINRNGVQAANMGPAFDYQFIYDIKDPSVWSSVAPFMLVQYHMSASHGEGNLARDPGDPDMVVVNPAAQFGKKVIFQIPSKLASASQPNFRNSVRIMLPYSEESKTTFDGHALNAVPSTAYTAFPGGGTGINGSQYEGVELDFAQNSGETTHIIQSDTGVGVYIYGYTTDDNYLWAGALGVTDASSDDSLPPIADTTGLCFCAHITLKDNRVGDSKINFIQIDSFSNVTFFEDTSFIDGVGFDSTFYDICVVDSSQPAYISVTCADFAGNITTVVSQYTPDLLEFMPCPLHFSGTAIGVPVFEYDTLYNESEFPVGFVSSNLKLINGGVGFVIDSQASDGIMQPGGFKVFKVKFTPAVKQNVSDTISYFDGCRLFTCEFIGNGGAVDFAVQNYDFECVAPGTTKSSIGVYIQNTTALPVQIDTIWVEDNMHFGYNSNNPATNKLPITVPSTNIQSGQYGVTFTTTAVGLPLGPYKTAAHFKNIGANVEHIDTLYATVCAPVITHVNQTDSSGCDAAIVMHVPFSNSTQYSDSSQIIQVIASDTVNFKNLSLESGTGSTFAVPHTVEVGDQFFAAVTFTPSQQTSGCFDDTINLVTSQGDTLTGIATGCTSWRAPQIVTGNVDFGLLADGAPIQTLTFRICNQFDDSLTITKFDTLNTPPSHDGAAFGLTKQYTVNGMLKPLPFTLGKGDCVDVGVSFNPSFALDPAQVGVFSFESNACIDTSLITNAATLSGPPQLLGFKAPVILSCGSNIDTAHIPYNQANTKQIVTLTINGPNAANFAVQTAVPITIAGNSNTPVLVQFLPTASAGLVNYAAQLVAGVVDIGQTDTSYVKDSIRASSNGMNLAINTKFSKTVVSPSDNTAMQLGLALQKNGLTDPLSSLGITKAVLTYSYDPGMLKVTDVKSAYTPPNNNWSIDAVNSIIDPVNGKIMLVLNGTQPIDDALTGLGQLNFSVILSPGPRSSSVTLTSDALFNASGDTVQGCLTLSHQDTGVTLVLQCGDTTLLEWMNGIPPTSIIPATPNPVTAATLPSVAFRYEQRVEGEISLSVYDVLGKEVARILDHVYHPAGSFEVFYDTSNLAGGSYVYRFTFDRHGAQSGRLVIDR